MRVWEFEDKKEAPSDLVLEQDFILRVRRMQRTGVPNLVLNFILTAIEPLKASPAAMKDAQSKLRTYAASSNGAYYEMSNGDVFLVWENPGEARLVSNRAIEAALEPYRNNTAVFLLTFRTPENYALLRECTNEYVEQARAKAAALGEKVDAQGSLTAKTVDYIERILAEVDIKKFGRSQSFFRDTKGVFIPIGEEYFISTEELRRTHCPKVEFSRRDHFFYAICSLFDQKLLGTLIENYSQMAGRRINLNLSIASIMGLIFAQFVRAVPRNERQNIGFEIHFGDIFQDFSLTLSAFQVLKREGFSVIIDNITPDVVPYVDLERLPVDALKIDASKDRLPQLNEPAVRKALERVPSSKLFFNHCDSAEAIKIGRALGVTVFQGWLIDDIVNKVKE
ncbi:MAG: EAL domain-containing protein [Alphaproteobacteria bacterium]|nr:EAL domain-containing protein [Alphaproteobacteria bacterium]